MWCGGGVTMWCSSGVAVWWDVGGKGGGGLWCRCCGWVCCHCNDIIRISGGFNDYVVIA